MIDLSKLRPRPVTVPAIDGWELYAAYEYGGPDHEDYVDYYAASQTHVRQLQVSRHYFTPTPERFSWIVRHGFPAGRDNGRGTLVPLDDAWIDQKLAEDGPSCLHCQYPSGCAPEPCGAYRGPHSTNYEGPLT